jgi:hypothetical protein
MIFAEAAQIRNSSAMKIIYLKAGQVKSVYPKTDEVVAFGVSQAPMCVQAPICVSLSTLE